MVTASAYRRVASWSWVAGLAAWVELGGRGERGAVAIDDAVQDLDSGEMFVDPGKELFLVALASGSTTTWRWFSSRPRVSIV